MTTKPPGNVMDGTALPRQHPDHMSGAPAPHPAGAATVPAVGVMLTTAIQIWSGGKDSAFALWTARQRGDLDVRALATMVVDGTDRTMSHGVRTEVMHRQAKAIGLPLHEIRVPVATNTPGDLDVLVECVAAFLQSPEGSPYPAVVWGDLYWDAARTWHDRASRAAGKAGDWPIWGWETSALAQAIVAAGFKAVVTSVDRQQLDPGFVGRAYDAAFLDDLPPGVDPCGERAEFDILVWDGPIFRMPLRLRRTRIARYGQIVYCDLAPVD